jgi:hypothetical protein
MPPLDGFGFVRFSYWMVIIYSRGVKEAKYTWTFHHIFITSHVNGICLHSYKCHQRISTIAYVLDVC